MTSLEQHPVMSYPTELSPDGRKALEVLRAARRQLAYYKQLADEARVVIEAELDPANAGTWGLGARAYTPTEQAAAARRAADAWKDTRPDE